MRRLFTGEMKSIKKLTGKTCYWIQSCGERSSFEGLLGHSFKNRLDSINRFNDIVVKARETYQSGINGVDSGATRIC